MEVVIVPGGRPNINIEDESVDTTILEAVEKLANMQCTQEEIAEFVGISVRTLKRNNEFCRLYKKGRENGRTSLRRMQWKKANDGNTTMLIWLGKQYLEQREKSDYEANVKQEIKSVKSEVDLDSLPLELVKEIAEHIERAEITD